MVRGGHEIVGRPSTTRSLHYYITFFLIDGFVQITKKKPGFTLRPPCLSLHTGGRATAIGWSLIRPSFLAAFACRRRGLVWKRERRKVLSRRLAHSPSPSPQDRTDDTRLAGSAFRLRLRRILFLSRSRNPFAGGALPPPLLRRHRRRNRREQSPQRRMGERRAVGKGDDPVRALVCRHCIGCRRGRHRRYRNPADITLKKQGTRRTFLRSSLPFY